jgi:hypothetical protein
MAAIGMSVSSLVVVVNALRLQRTELRLNRSRTSKEAIETEEEALV